MEIIGKYSRAVVYTDNIESEATAQIFDLLNTKMTENQKVRVMPDCLTEDSEILTNSGFKKIVDLSDNDIIGNYNPVTKLIEFYPPKSIIIRPLKDGEKVYEYVNNRGYSFKVSENHRMAFKPKMGEVAKNINSFLMCENIFNGNGVSNSISKYSDNELRLLCWIVGDGYIHTTHNTHTESRRIKFGLKKRRKVDRIIELLNQEQIKYSIFYRKKQTEIAISVKDSKKFINWVGINKEFPSDLIFISKNQSDIFFNELIQVDGDYETYVKSNRKIYRINSINLRTLNIIASIASINKGLSKTVTRSMNSFNGTTNMSYINIVNESSLIKSKGGINNSKFIRNEISYSGNLVCVETNTGFFIARQNGLTFITGNCHSGSGCVIGYTQTYSSGPLDPDVVGIDISCGVLSTKYKAPKEELNLPLIDHRIREAIPMGFELNQKTVVNEKEFKKFLKGKLERARSLWPEFSLYDNQSLGNMEDFISKTLKRLGMEERVFWKSLGTLGGGERVKIASGIVNSYSL